MQYHQDIIYAHRPWMSKSHIQPQPPQGPGHNHARGMCIQSATAIARILAMYETRYTLRRIHTKAVASTSSAVLLLLFAAVTRYHMPNLQQDGNRVLENDIPGHLSTCFRALDEFAICWPSAAKAKDMLLRLQRRWEIRTRSQKGGWGFGPDGQPNSNGPIEPDPGQLENGVLPHESIGLDAGVDWMLMPDEPSPSDSRAAELYNLLSNPIAMHPGRENI